MTKLENVSGIVKSRNAKTGIRITNHRVRRQGLHMTGKQLFLIVVMVLLFLGSGISYVWSNFEKTQRGYSLSQLKREEMRLRERNTELRLELATVKAPQRIDRRAMNELGMQTPLPEQIIVLQ